MAKIKCSEYTKCSEKLDHSYIAGWNVKWYIHSAKEFGSFFFFFLMFI